MQNLEAGSPGTRGNLADFRHGGFTVLIRSDLGNGFIAEDQHGARHVTQFVDALGTRDGYVVATGRKSGHRLGQVTNRHGDVAAQLALEGHGDADQSKAADSQGYPGRGDGGTLAARLFLKLCLFAGRARAELRR